MWYERTYSKRWYHKLWPWSQIIVLMNRLNTITDEDLNDFKRPTVRYWKMEWMKIHNEVRILHAALRRKNIVINNLRKKNMRQRKEEA
jgi:hypothetical protein